MRILVVDDDKSSAFVLQQTLIHHKHQAECVFDGEEALKKVQKEKFDVLLVDWMLPKMDGIELVRRLRKQVIPTPIIVMLTAITLPRAQEHALQAGADDYIAKPYEPRALLQRISDAMHRRAQPAPASVKAHVKPKSLGVLPNFVAVVVGTSTGGPVALKQVLQKLPAETKEKCSFFVVLHGPDWMLLSLSDYLADSTPFTIKLATNRMRADPGHVYLAPAGKHLIVVPDRFEMHLTETEKENYVRPAADPLFRSAADSFGRYCVAVVLTGMGRDGTQGASHLAAAGGVVLAQDPDSAVAPSMPTTVIQAGLAAQVPTLEEMGKAISEEVSRLYDELQEARKRK